MDTEKVLEAVNVLESGQVGGQCHHLHHHRTFCSRASPWVNTGVGFYSERRHRFNVIKKFQSVEESGPGGQLGDWLPRKVSEEAGRRCRAVGTN